MGIISEYIPSKTCMIHNNQMIDVSKSKRLLYKTEYEWCETISGCKFVYRLWSKVKQSCKKQGKSLVETAREGSFE